MSQQSREAALKKRRTRTIVSSLVLVVAALVLLRALIVPDPGGHLLFARAKRLEDSGLVQPALRQYLLLASSYPKSDLAAQALWNAADLQTDLARAGEPALYLAARKTYLHLADTYFNSSLASAALLNAGDLSLDPLHDFPAARFAFERVLREYSQTQDESGARATLGLGRVAQGLEERDAAKRWYERVLSRYGNQTELCAQTQFRLGETYETLFRDHPLWARAAYEKTIKTYSNSAWASQAKERLGLLLYAAPPRERRVIVEAKAMADAGNENATSRLAALRMVLRVRGVNASQTLMNGLTLAPFYAGFRADDPGRAVRVPLNDFDNAVANAGLLYETEDGGDITSAARTLQREVDAGHATLIFTGRWQFVAGYDSSRGEVTLQDGARLVTQSLAQLASVWKKRAPDGSGFSVLSFHAPGETAQSRILPPGAKKTNAAASAAVPTKSGAGAISKGVPLAPAATLPGGTATPVAASTRAPQKPRATPTSQTFAPQLSPLSPPTYVVTLAPLDEGAMYRRVARGAANAMRRARSGDAFLNLEALQVLSDALQRAADSALPVEESTGENPGDFATPAPTEPPVRQQNAPADNALEPTSFPREYSPFSANEFAAGKNHRPAPTADSSFASTRHAVPFSNTASTRTRPAASFATQFGAFSHQRRGARAPFSTANRASFAASTRGAIFVAQIEPPQAPTSEVTATPEAPAPSDENPVAPPDDTRVAPSQNAAQLRALANWRGAASRQWSVSRRAAAAFCDEAAARSGDASFAAAAKLFRESARDLESAAAALPAAESREYSRAAFANAARFVQSAQGAETRATQLLAKAGA